MQIIKAHRDEARFNPVNKSSDKNRVCCTHQRNIRRAGFTVVELLVVIAIIGLLISLILPAVQSSRQAARRMECSNRLRQLGLALHQFEADHKHFPSGRVSREENEKLEGLSWLTSLLPYIEQDRLWNDSMVAFRIASSPFKNPPHTPFGKAVTAFGCPADSRVERPVSASSANGAYVGLTSYLGVAGLNHLDQSGVFYSGSRTRLSKVTDGLSNTVCCGERPPSPDFNYGWWYTGAGQDLNGSADLFLGLNETAVEDSRHFGHCSSPSKFSDGQLTETCDALHFWSLHRGGANFLLCDGSVRYFAYESADVLTKMATVAGTPVSSGTN